MALIDSDFAKNQLLLLLHEWYMHPDGQLRAYEWAFSDVNPPVHAWAAWHIYKQEKESTGKGDSFFLEENRPYVPRLIARWQDSQKDQRKDYALLSIVRGADLENLLTRMLDPQEFLSDYGIRSISKYHEAHPYVLNTKYGNYSVNYEPGESTTGAFGGNSTSRGPIWFPINFLLVEALQKYHQFYGDDFLAEYPTGSGTKLTLGQVTEELARRLTNIFLRDDDGG